MIRDTDGNAFVPGTPNISMDVDYTVETVSGDNSQQSKIAYLGYYGKTAPTDKDYAFTQMMIWQTLPASDQTANGKDGKGAFRSYFNDPAVHRKEYDEWKEKIQEKTASWNTYPAFHKKTISIQAGETLELTDSNRGPEDYGNFLFTQDKVTVSHQKGQQHSQSQSRIRLLKGICNHERAGTCSGRGAKIRRYSPCKLYI
ncbi:MAG: Cys-Gln thioester bond-forming surface protein [Merdibacter sp.]